MGDLEKIMSKLLAENLMVVETLKEDYITEMAKLTSVPENDIRNRLIKLLPVVKDSVAEKVKLAIEFAETETPK